MLSKMLLALVLTVASACTSGEVSEARGAWPKSDGTLVVVNQLDSTVCLIDLESGQVVKTVPTGKGPHEAAVSPDGRTVAVTIYGGSQHGGPGNSLTILELPKGEVTKTVSLEQYTAPHGVTWLDNDRVLVTSETTQNLVVVNVTQGKVERVLHTGMKGSHLAAVTPDAKAAYSGNVGSGNVSAFDLVTGRKLWDAEAGPASEGIGVSPDGRYVWTGNRGDHSVSIIDTRTKERVKKLECPGLPYRVLFTADGKYALVATPMSASIALFDAAKMSELARISLTQSGIPFASPNPGPAGMAMHPNGKLLFATVVNSAAVVAIDLEQRKVLGKIEVGKSPDGVAVSRVKLEK